MNNNNGKKENTRYEQSTLKGCYGICSKMHYSKYEENVIHGRVSRRRLVLNPTIQQVVINL